MEREKKKQKRCNMKNPFFLCNKWKNNNKKKTKNVQYHFWCVVFLLFYVRDIYAIIDLDEPTFTVVAIPDTQYYTAYHKEIFQWQTYWICACQSDMNTAVAVHLGDIVEHNNMEEHEWLTAKQAFRYLKRCKVPTTALPGNHDTRKQDKTLYDKYLPYHFFEDWFSEPSIVAQGYEYHVYDTNTSRNGYVRFSKGGQSFIQLHIGYVEYLPDRISIMDWAENVIKNHPNDLVLISTHYAASDCYTLVQMDVYTLMKENCNVLMAFGGHVFECGGEKIHHVTNVCGETRHVFITDYQGRKEGGDGWIRFYTFHKDSSMNGTINKPPWFMCAATYTPKHKRYEIDDNSFFSLNISSGEIGEGCPSSLQYECGQNYIPRGTIYIVTCIVTFVFFFLVLIS